MADLLRWRWTLVDLVVAGFVWLFGLDAARGSLRGVAIGALMSLALFRRRQRPMTVMLVVSALAFLETLVLDQVPTGYDMAIFVAMVAVVTHAERTAWVYLSGAIALAGTVIVAVRHGAGLGSDSATLDGDLQMLTFIGITGAVWLIAYVLRTRKIEAVNQAERAATAERERDHLAQLAVAEERAAIARELHDVVAHSLSVMILQADGATFALDTDPDRARTAIRHVAATGRDALDDMRRIVGLLRGAADDDSGTDRSPIGLDQLEPLVERARVAGLDARLLIDGERPALSAADELTIFRLVQEGLTNVLRHAGTGAAVTVSLRFDAGTAVLGIVDDGAGRTATELTPDVGRPRLSGGGNGLIGMRERVAALGGSFDAGPRLGTGWEVRAVAPVKVAP